MLAFFLALLFDDAPTQAPKVWTSRAAFHQAINQVKDDWTKDQVLKVLGRPDDVWPPNDSSNYVMAGDEAWCYGTNGHHTMPTLGYVVFREGKVLSVIGGWGDPPPASIIAEKELVSLLRLMYRKPNRMAFPPYSGDPRRLIQVANALIPLGKEKALAVMLEYSRVGRWHDDEWLFWLVRAMFEPIGPKGGFRVPRIGAMSPRPPEDLREWPTYPVVLIDDVPVLVYKGASLAGVPESFQGYAREESENWKIKTRKLTPPNDPFPVFLKVLQTSYWPFKGTKVDDAAIHVESYEDSAIPLVEILNLVRTAYRPVGQRDSYDRYPNGLSYQQLHSEFLLSGARWDDQRQLYVRRDGTFTLDEVVEYVQHTYKFEGVPGLEIELQCERNNEDTVGYRAYVSEIGKQKISNAVIVAIEVGTNKELHWMALNESPDDMMREQIKSAYLSEAPHSPMLQGGHAIGSGFKLAAGKSVRFVVLQRDREYVGPTIIP